MSYPEMMAVPLVGEASPIRMLNVVVLPAPVVHTINVSMFSKSLETQGHECTIDSKQSKTFSCRNSQTDASHCFLSRSQFEPIQAARIYLEHRDRSLFQYLDKMLMV